MTIKNLKFSEGLFARTIDQARKNMTWVRTKSMLENSSWFNLKIKPKSCFCLRNSKYTRKNCWDQACQTSERCAVAL